MKCSWESHLSGYLNENIHFVSVCRVNVGGFCACELHFGGDV